MTTSGSVSAALDRYEPEPADVARQGAERVAHEVLRAQHGGGAVVPRPISRRLRSELMAPADYAQGVAAARAVMGHAEALMKRYANKARGEGVPWRDLAGPLNVNTEDEWTSPAEAAFEYVAGERWGQFDARRTVWECQSCGGTVTDYGPYNGHPVDCETGHEDGCRRHTAEIRQHERQIEGD